MKKNKFWEFIYFIFPLKGNYDYNKKVREKLESNEDSESILKNIENLDRITLSVLKEVYDQRIQQKDKLEDKAKINVIGISIAVTLMTGSYSLIENIKVSQSLEFLVAISTVLLIYSIFSMICAGYLSIKVITDENSVDLIKIDEKEENLLYEYDRCISKNTLRNIIRNNYVYSSYECMRNAIIGLFIVFIISLIPINESIAIPNYMFNNKDFYYGENTIEILKTDDTYQRSIEQSIQTYISKNPNNLKNDFIGIIDSKNNLYVKFKIDDNEIFVSEIEHFEN